MLTVAMESYTDRLIEPTLLDPVGEVEWIVQNGSRSDPLSIVADEMNRALRMASSDTDMREVISAIETLGHIRSLDSDESRAEALLKLTDHLSESGLREAMDVARAIDRESARNQARKDVNTPTGRTGPPVEALDEARKIDNAGVRAELLVKVSSHLANPSDRDEALGEALAEARKIDDAAVRSRILVRVSSHLANPWDRDKVQSEALAAVQTMNKDVEPWVRKELNADYVKSEEKRERERSFVLANVAAELSESAVREAIRMARNSAIRGIGTVPWQSWPLAWPSWVSRARLWTRSDRSAMPR